MNLSLQAKFTNQVDVWVVEAIGNGQPHLGELLRSLPGIYPAEVLQSLNRLAAKGRISQECQASIVREAQTKVVAATGVERQPHTFEQLEHPLDFEWRFTRNANARLIKKIQEYTSERSGAILCLGCPSVYVHGREQIPSHKFHLGDKNASALGQISEAHNLANCDLAHGSLRDMPAQVAVIDPPWYNDYYKLFIWAALQNLKPAGLIILSFPPVGTRPSAIDDFAAIISWSREIGLELQEHLESELSYRSPLFEVNALKRDGLWGVPLDWRRGDLIVLKVKEKVIIPRPAIPAFATHWTEVRFGLVRIKIREDLNIPNAVLDPVGDSAILPSVSSRHPLRARANVVTSGNRFLRTEYPTNLVAIGQELSVSQVDRLNTSESNLLLRNELIRLLALEQAEVSEYLMQINDL